MFIFRKTVFGCLFLITSLAAFGQKEFKTTNSFTISGAVKSPMVVTFSDLEKMESRLIGSVVITNHLGEKKSEAKDLKGVLLKDVMKSLEFVAESPKVLSEFYFVCKATDGYTVVFSWNELFNSPTGDAVFIVTEKNGNKLRQMDDAMLLLSPTDFKTGRRHVKSLTTIEAKRAQ